MGTTHSTSYFFMKYVQTKDVLNPDQKIVRIHDTDEISRTIDYFLRSKLESTPVRSSTMDCDVGMVDLNDFLVFFVKIVSKYGLDREQINHHFFRGNINQILNLADNKVIPITIESNLQEIIRTMIVGDIDRLTISDKEGNYEHLLTLFDLIKFLYININDLIPHNKKTVGKLKIAEEAHKISDQKTALDAFKVLVNEKVPAVVVLNEKNVPYTVITTNDLNFLKKENYFMNIGLPLNQFIKKYRIANLNFCNNNTSFKDMLSNVVKYKLQYILILSEKIQIITLRTILKYFDVCSEHYFDKTKMKEREMNYVMKKMKKNFYENKKFYRKTRHSNKINSL